MIHFHKYTLPNGLRILVHVDESTPIVAINTLYDVGARDETPDKTGFAHLFEHLMFGGSIHIPQFDTPLQEAGGNNNAFTSNDITNYYVTLPVENVETALWLESDRMLNLAFSPESLEVQRKVVIEEFKQRYLNQPYGDVWLELRPMAYKTHPYRWATIGQSIAHIEDATLEDVKAFFAAHYNPANAILSIAGNVDPERIFQQVEHWYADIPAKVKPLRNLPTEQPNKGYELKTLLRNVPQNALYMAWSMPERMHPDYPACDLLSDILGQGKSSRLYEALVKNQALFTSISCYVTGSIDPGLLVISGMLDPQTDFETARAAVMEILANVRQTAASPKELQKVKNQFESNYVFSQLGVLNKAMNAAFFELLGDAELANTLTAHYAAVEAEDIHRLAGQIFQDENLSELRIQSTHV